MTPASPTAVYRMSVDAVLAAQVTDARLGLGTEEARARLERYGRNELASERPTPAWRKFLAQFSDVLVILLLIATADVRVAVADRARLRRCHTKPSRFSASCFSTRSWVTCSRRAPSRRSRP